MREVRSAKIVNSAGPSKGEQTQLHYFCEKGKTASVVRMLEMTSIDVEARLGGREDGLTCLMTAAFNGRLDICRFLIDKGAQANALDWNGRTPLHWAAIHGSVEIVRLLCDHGTDIKLKNTVGWRPLHYAALWGHISVVKELIEERNAEINARDNEGDTALTWARHENKPDVAAYLVSRGGIA